MSTNNDPPLNRSPPRFIPSFNRDTVLLIAQRFVRTIAYGTSTLILVQYLSSLEGFSSASIGLFQASTLWGDVVVSLLLTMYADKMGKRNVLLAGSGMMVFAGAVFAWGVMDLDGKGQMSGTSRWLIMSFASIVGVISPSGNEVGPFKAVEESMLADLNPASTRSVIYAFYALIGNLGAALGMFTCGLTLQFLTARMKSPVGPYRVAFLVYTICGAVKMVLTLMLSEATEGGGKEELKMNQRDGRKDVEEETRISTEEDLDPSDSPSAPLITTESSPNPVTPMRPLSLREKIISFLTPNIHKKYLPLLLELSLIFAVDSIGSGLASASWVTFYFSDHFHLEPAALGSLFTVTNLISSGMALIAARISQLIGNLPTMIVTHLPSAIFLASIPLAQSSRNTSIFLVLCRSALQSMDSAPRQAFLASAVDSSARTAIMGIINVVKTGSQSLGPWGTGLFAQYGALAWGIGMGGVMKIVYNLLLMGMMLRMRKGTGPTVERQD